MLGLFMLIVQCHANIIGSADWNTQVSCSRYVSGIDIILGTPAGSDSNKIMGFTIYCDVGKSVGLVYGTDGSRLVSMGTASSCSGT